MPTALIQSATLAQVSALEAATHILFVLPDAIPAGLPFEEQLRARMARKRVKYEELAKTPLQADLPNGAMVTWLVLDVKVDAYQQLTGLRKALVPLLEEKPAVLTIAIFGDDAFRQKAAEAALYVAEVNAAQLPVRKGKKETAYPLNTIQIFGWESADQYKEVRACAAGNILARELTVLPPNELTPGHYRERIAALAKENGWQHEEFDMESLRKMEAGAFVAVAQGSDPQDAAIVHLSYVPENPSKTLALVGKGICFDTGGHNLKPARYMNGMHEDMNGSAVALGILAAATLMKLPVRIDCWLAIAQNHIGPKAYKQNDVVKALNGTTIEIVHTDAEGRMVLADTLTLASRQKPAFMMDFATLTGSMIGALGDRYSGVLGNRPELLVQAVEAGRNSGERVCAFPFDEDYEEELDSDIADIKQCTLESEADHILAARFLARFIEKDVPWVHVDLSACRRKGGLGAVASDVTGFGVRFSLRLLQTYLNS